MVDYVWRCNACNNTNEPHTDTCAHCGCPANANAQDVEVHAAKYKASKGKKFSCTKCSHDQYQTGEVRASGGGISAIFDLETEKFVYITCSNCGYTEFYKGTPSMLGHIMDWGI